MKPVKKYPEIGGIRLGQFWHRGEGVGYYIPVGAKTWLVVFSPSCFFCSNNFSPDILHVDHITFEYETNVVRAFEILLSF